jgi:hypothetical protein
MIWVHDMYARFRLKAKGKYNNENRYVNQPGGKTRIILYVDY